LIAAFSSSSPIASVALLGEEGELIGSASETAPMAASGACLRLLDTLLREAGRELGEVSLFVADVGPGSFTGTRVGVVLAKTLALAQGTKTAGVSAFDLIGPDLTAAVPSRKGEYFLRIPGAAPIRLTEVPEDVVGYGSAFAEPRYPLAERVTALLAKLVPIEPEALVPEYLLEPSISQPKSPYRLPGAVGG
jgi:tRNA threonylcarbamoyl adenosine modification protein YeaZ